MKDRLKHIYRPAQKVYRPVEAAMNEPKPAATDGGMITLTFEQLQTLLKAQSADQAEAMKQFGIELRKPTPEEAEKLADAKVRAARARAERIADIEAEAAGKAAGQAACESNGHKKENGRSAIGGQIHNDGLFHPFCIRCFKEFTPTKPHSDMISGGVQMTG